MDYSNKTYKELVKEEDELAEEFDLMLDNCAKEGLSYFEFCRRAKDVKEKLYFVSKYRRLKQNPVCAGRTAPTDPLGNGSRASTARRWYKRNEPRAPIEAAHQKVASPKSEATPSNEAPAPPPSAESQQHPEGRGEPLQRIPAQQGAAPQPRGDGISKRSQVLQSKPPNKK